LKVLSTSRDNSVLQFITQQKLYDAVEVGVLNFELLGVAVSRVTSVLFLVVDSVCHSKLIAKLRSYGICGCLLEWIADLCQMPHRLLVE